MSGPANLVVTKSEGARQALHDLVMAWARDIETGEPRYILELDAAHRGAKCGCECASCGKPLTAVNAAKAEFVKRAHFRHPEGAEREECLVLSARGAALRQMQEEGWLDLPRRSRSGRVAGLSGKFYEAWVETPPARLRISQVDYRDSATAVVTLDDGRQVRVDLTGTPGCPDIANPDARSAPTIYLAINDPVLASLSPEELRRRARLQPTELCWHSHWDDAGLLARAEEAARAQAQHFFDDVPSWIVLPEGLNPALRRESVLHYEVKRLLAEAETVTVPEVVIEDEVPAPGGKRLRGRWVDREEDLRLANVELESRYGGLIPDITCEAFGADGHARHLPLLIEVTVTNTISQERLDRIRAEGEATLEIDLSLAGGRVNRDELRSLVVEEAALKRWLFRPDFESERARLRAALTKQAADEQAELDARERWLAERRSAVLAAPIEDVVAEYLEAVTTMLEARGEATAMRVARERVSDAANKLAMRGYSEAGDEQLIGSRGLLTFLLSIQRGRPFGFRHHSLIEVLKSQRERAVYRRSNLSIFFIALRAYPLEVDVDDVVWFEEWAHEVRLGIQAGDADYLRDPFYDRLLSLLFPEMASGLAKPFGKLKPGDGVRWDQKKDMFVRPEVPDRRPARFLETQPRADSAKARLLDTRPGQWWLQGRDLEAWKKAHPEAAQAWFPEIAGKSG